MSRPQGNQRPDGAGQDDPIRTGRRRLIQKPEGHQESLSTESLDIDEQPEFHFLHVSEPLQRPNKNHRHVVRTHVMRNFHSKKKKQPRVSDRSIKPKKSDGRPAEIPSLDSMSGVISSRSSPPSSSRQVTQQQTVLRLDDFSILNPARRNPPQKQNTNPILIHQRKTSPSSYHISNSHPPPAFDRWLFNTSK